MKKEAKILVANARSSLVLSMEHFNRPWETGRHQAVLFFLDHSFEQLLKAAILQRGGKIREKNKSQTIGFDECLRRALSNETVQFLNEDQVLSLQAINSMRDAAYHHILDISESHLYVLAQSGVTLFKDILQNVFDQDISTYLPRRVLPLSTQPPEDFHVLFEREVAEIVKLLQPRKRKRVEAKSKLRSLAIMESSIQGERLQPSDKYLEKIEKQIRSGRNWDEVFPGVASINLTSEGTGPSLDLRITKKEGVPVHLVNEGTPGASVIGIKRVNELDFYNLGTASLAKKVGLTLPKTSAVIWHANIKQDPDCYKKLQVGKQRFDRYSPKAIKRVKEYADAVGIETIWTEYQKQTGFGQKGRSKR